MPADRLLVLARFPETGHVLAALSPPLTPDEAADVYEASLRDVVARAARERGRVEIWFDGDDSDTFWFQREFRGTLIRRASGNDLASRMSDALERSFADGAERVVLIPATVPTLPEPTLTGAFRDLEEAGAVVAQGADGRPVLFGVRRPAWPAARTLFDQRAMTEESTVEAMLQRATRASLDVRVLPGWYTIETHADLARAAADAHPQSHLGRWVWGEAGRVVQGE